MALIVQKYGGTSVGDIERIKNVAKRVARTCDEGNQVVVVLSAMSGETNKLVGLCNEASEFPVGREYDVVISTGEQVTIGLLSIVLKEMGRKAKSFMGHQVPIVTDSRFGSARIESIDDRRMREALANGAIVVVAGFQGVDSEGNITTLGRGGSDTTAVALAAALKADLCEIYTDVDGVYTTDPNICQEARKLRRVSYDEMLEMASLGAKVLQTRSVEFAKKYEVPLMVRSSFNDTEGTIVCKEDREMEKVMVSGITYNKNEAKISVLRVPDRPGIAAKLFRPLTEAGINVDMIVQNISQDAHTDLTFTVSKEDFKRALKLVEETAGQIEAKDVVGDPNIAKVSIVGAGMRSHAGVASRMFDVMSAEGINIQMISTSEIKISVVVDVKYTELAVRVLHESFGLGNSEVVEEAGV
ncbi:MAG TPA: aspartate kinase [Deltaproteobacteria bacterium]|nr:MAG: aspartate kinase [Deltaproteobacteria bacterium GWA2_55_82]OGQ64014.1 MAG: aspartate kinase [Deltaproteobacteria bacterium RIFCSPLOWO2_02_FULL_55_12]OIJ73448.1 MAG: aspartate kinase [Deltaproteobacteria bacterium GWC2_55_46]HBG47312.1 aspartate kinase [Deltaproteobacteria bacterium]HCY10078.1 aspartate kinase [Deltaproteobacteria bacterium]